MNWDTTSPEHYLDLVDSLRKHIKKLMGAGQFRQAFELRPELEWLAGHVRRC